LSLKAGEHNQLRIIMKTEKEKMLAGELYNALDEQISNERTKARLLIKKLNDASGDVNETATAILKELIPNAGKDLWIQPPFFCDYGYNIEAGERVFFNFNCVVLDVMKVSIGSRTLFGPNVQIYTATHPINFKERATGLEFAKPISDWGRRLGGRQCCNLSGCNYRQQMCYWGR
jgi:maltose O-acetyltransferase